MKPNAYSADCPTRQILDRVGDKWAVLILLLIRHEPMSNQVVIDREAAAIVYQVVDNRTSEVIKQFPEEAVLRRRAYFRTLELAKDAPTRLRATDRKA